MIRLKKKKNFFCSFLFHVHRNFRRSTGGEDSVREHLQRRWDCFSKTRLYTHHSLSLFCLFVNSHFFSRSRHSHIRVLTNFLGASRTVNKLGHFRRCVARKLFVTGSAAKSADVVHRFLSWHVEKHLNFPGLKPPFLAKRSCITNALYYLFIFFLQQNFTIAASSKNMDAL